MSDQSEKNQRGNAGQFFVAGELCRRGYVASVTMGNTQGVDILCSNSAWTKFVYVQVKTYPPSEEGVTVPVGTKAERIATTRIVYVLIGLPDSDTASDAWHPEYYIIPSRVVAEKAKADHATYTRDQKREVAKINDPSKREMRLRKLAKNKMRTLRVPPKEDANGWSVADYKNRWDIIERLLN